LRGGLGRAVAVVVDGVRAVQTGEVGDYVTWFVIGVAVYGGLLLWWR
jgi:hypothetical protein